MTLFAFGVDRFYILLSKLDYVLVSLITAESNTKQRFKGQILCFVIQYTLLLPISLGVILVTTILDTATMPLLGFAFFVIGYPKPLKCWSSMNAHYAAPTDVKSDGHLYHSMLHDLSSELQHLVEEDPFSLTVGRFYFMKNEKMIILI